MSATVYDVITSRIIDSLKQNVIPWRIPWTMKAPTNLVSKRPYRGVNVFLLSASRFTSPYWLTYRQAEAKGGHVRKGEKSTPVVFWKVFDNAKEGKEKLGRSSGAVLRYYSVFNATQCEGIEVPADPERPAFVPVDECERILAAYTKGPGVEHGGDRACYIPNTDKINMPAKETFHTPEEYYSTLFHEEVHGTGARIRLDREGVTDPIKFASHTYSYEELVAECGASFLNGEAGTLPLTLDNSTAYIAHWVSKLQSEPKWIVKAAGEAAKAADYILGRGAYGAVAVDDSEQIGEEVA